MNEAGVIESIGEEVTKAASGERIYFGGTITGSYAEKAI